MALAAPELGRQFLARRHTALLVAIIAAFAVRPLIGDRGEGPVVFSIALLGLMLVALYTVQLDEVVGERAVLVAQRRRRSIVGWTLAVVGIGERIGASFFPSPQLLAVGTVSWTLFFGFVAWVELRSVLKQREVTSETISMSISVYLLMGLCWGLVYIMLFQHRPDAFSFGGPTQAPNANDQTTVFPVFIYFSLTTLSTIGFGDITPVTLAARYTAVAEGITGQFYLAILVARLVGMQMSQAASSSERK